MTKNTDKQSEELDGYSLDAFIENTKLELDRFKASWLENNKKDPENWPLTLGPENQGLWFECFSLWDEEN